MYVTVTDHDFLSYVTKILCHVRHGHDVTNHYLEV
jgi:hypothetical protein